MADLYRSLIDEDYNSEHRFVGKDFEILNSLFDGDESSMPRKFYEQQIKTLRELEKGMNFEATNDFIRRANNKEAEFEETENLSASEAFASVVEIMNRAFNSSENSIKVKEYVVDPKTGRSTKDTKYYTAAEQRENLRKAKEDLNKVLSQLHTTGAVDASLVKTLDGALLKEKGSKNQYIKEKATEIEDLLVELLNQSGFFAINTGAFYNGSKQLIEDALAFSDKNKKLGDGNISFSFTIKKDKTSETVSGIKTIDDFFKAVDKVTSQGYAIHLPDELYEALVAASDITAQAKSGMRQSILNAQSTKRNAISLEEVGFNKDSFNLWKLYELQNGAYHYFRQEANQDKSGTMELLANYCLSRNVERTSLNKNKLYASVHGLQTASQWMESAKQYLHFNPGVFKLSDSIYENPHPYAFIDL